MIERKVILVHPEQALRPCCNLLLDACIAKLHLGLTFISAGRACQPR